MLDFTKEDLIKKLNILLGSIESNYNLKYEDILQECTNLYQKVILISDTDLGGLIELRKQYIIISGKLDKLSGKNYIRTYQILGSFILMLAAIFFLLNDMDWNQYFSLIILGLIGALTYLLVNELSELTSNKHVGTRISLAAIMPFLLLCIFMDHESFALKEVYLLSFTFGFSVEIVLLFLQKIVEKAKRILE